MKEIETPTVIILFQGYEYKLIDMDTVTAEVSEFYFKDANDPKITNEDSCNSKEEDDDDDDDNSDYNDNDDAEDDEV